MSKHRAEDIKKLDGYIKPIVTRNGTQIVSVGIKEGERYYQYNKATNRITGSFLFDQAYHKGINNLSRYLSEIAHLIDEGQIYIERVKTEIEPEPIVKEHDDQISLF
jgi:hypothetical protein